MSIIACGVEYYYCDRIQLNLYFGLDRVSGTIPSVGNGGEDWNWGNWRENGVCYILFVCRLDFVIGWAKFWSCVLLVLVCDWSCSFCLYFSL